MASKVTASAPGKIIISGEHTVVYGYPAIVASINKRLKLEVSTAKSFDVKPETSKIFVYDALEVFRKHINFSSNKLNVNIDTQIPIGRGMGSSASFAVAMSMALLELFKKDNSLDKVSDLAYELEKVYHGKPSGVDISIATRGGILWYRKETESFKTFSGIEVKRRLPEIFILDTGKPKESTKETIAYVARQFTKSPGRIEKIFKETENVTKSLLRYLLAEKSYGFTEILRDNEKLLEALGVVSPTAKKIIREIEKTGGAAKISGGGGITGPSGIILVYHVDKEKLLDFAKKRNLKLKRVVFGGKGVTIEK